MHIARAWSSFPCWPSSIADCRFGSAQEPGATNGAFGLRKGFVYCLIFRGILVVIKLEKNHLITVLSD